MKQESKEFWELIMYRYIRGYEDLKKKGVEIKSVETYNNEFYIIYMKDREGEIIKTELGNNVIQHFLDTFKTSYSEIVLDKELNFNTVITDYELYNMHIKQVEYAKNDILKAIPERTYDVIFNDDTDSNSKGFESSFDYCKNYILSFNGSNHSYFADYKGGVVQVVCNETGEVVYEEEVF